MLRVQRLRYIGTLYGCSALVAWGLLQEDHQWIELVEDDLRWLWHQLQGHTHLPDPTHHPSAWLDLIQRHPRYWKRLIRRGSEHACKQRSREHHLVEFHMDILAYMRSQGFSIPEVSSPPSHPAETHFGCTELMDESIRFATSIRPPSAWDA